MFGKCYQIVVYHFKTQQFSHNGVGVYKMVESDIIELCFIGNVSVFNLCTQVVKFI